LGDCRETFNFLMAAEAATEANKITRASKSVFELRCGSLFVPCTLHSSAPHP
jgi:hypothetical protein